MGGFRRALLTVVLFVVVGLIVLTWGSIGSAVMTLGLLLAGGFLLHKHINENHNPDDFDWEA